jgi:hypothetical protein
MALTFSVPTSVFPLSSEASSGSSAMDVDRLVLAPKDSMKPACDVPGCFSARKCKLAKDWTKGACGMVI